MRMLSGALVIVAGAIVFGAAIIGQELCQATGHYADAAAGFGFFFAVALWVLGIMIMAARIPDRGLDRPPAPPV